MYDALDLSSVLFLDIETVSGEATYQELDPVMAGLWDAKARSLHRNDPDFADADIPAAYVDRAAIYAEFGRIVCISVGFIGVTEDGPVLRVKSFADPEEAVVLEEFAGLLNSQRGFRFLCGHNINEFDVPYIGRRMLVHRMTLPAAIDLRGKKPWDLKHLIDTMEMWRFADRKAYTSLKLLAALFGIPSPKDDIDGSQVGRVFWEDNDLERIAVYCEKDVVATANVFLALSGREGIGEEAVVFVGR